MTIERINQSISISFRTNKLQQGNLGNVFQIIIHFYFEGGNGAKIGL